MKETTNDSYLYSRAVAGMLTKTAPQGMEETQRAFMRRVALDAIMVFEDEIDLKRRLGEDRLTQALLKSREKFNDYAAQHRAKGTPDGVEKAITNEGMVEMITQTLAQR